MTIQKTNAMWAGWSGTAVFMVSWLLISHISSFSFPLWIGLMLLGAVLCFYGGIRCNKWFFLPSGVAITVLIGVLVAVFTREGT